MMETHLEIDYNTLNYNYLCVTIYKIDSISHVNDKQLITLNNPIDLEGERYSNIHLNIHIYILELSV